MNELIRKNKKLLALLLSVLMVLSVIPFSMAFAANEIVVVDATGTLVNGATDSSGKTIVLKDTISAAIDYLGTAGGTVYIKGTYDMTLTNMEGSVSGRKHVVIEGYGGASGNVLDIADTFSRNQLSLLGTMEVKNLTIKTPATIEKIDNSDSRNLLNLHFCAVNYTFTFGEGLVMTGGYGMPIGGRGAHLIDIRSGEYSIIAPWAAKTSSTYKYKTSVYNIYGGTIHYLATSPILYEKSSKHPYLDGDFTANIYGGTVDKAYIGAWGGSDVVGYVRGNSLVNVEDGTVPTIVFGSSRLSSVTTAAGNTGNVAVIVNGSKTANGVTNIKSNDNAQYITKGAGKKFMVIINNAEGGKATIDLESNDYLKNIVDYKVEVIGGEARPVYEGSGQSAVLLGFTLKDAEGEGLAPMADGVALTAIGTTAEGDSYYALPETLGTTTVTEVTFAVDTANYNEFIKLRNPLTNTLEKLERNEDINVVYFGGSVTAGYGATSSSKYSWRALTGEYITKLATDMGSTSTINNISKALGESGTFMGAYRTPHDIITADPDLLFIEYAINDAYGSASYRQSMQRMETIVREVRLAHPDCDIVFVLTTDEGRILDARNGVLHANAQAHEDLAKAYGISTIQVGAALASLMPEGELTAEQVQDFWRGTDDSSSTDGYAIDWSHPNDNGYAMYFSVVKEFLNKEFAGENTNTAINIDVTNKNTVVSDNLFDGNRMIIYGDGSLLVTNSASAPVSGGISFKDLLANSKGFTLNDTAVNIGHNSSYGGTLELEKGTYGELTATFEGTELAIYADFDSSAKFKYSIDGGADVTVTAGATGPYIVFEGIAPGTHTVTLKFDWNDGLLLDGADDEALNISLILLRDASKQTKGKPSAVVIDKTGTLNNGDEAIGGGTIMLKNTITEAIDYLGAEGGTVYVSGAYVPADGMKDYEGTATTARGKVTIAGYGGAEGNSVDLSAGGNIPLKGALTFENITIVGPATTVSSISEAMNNSIGSNGQKLTFGEGITVTGGAGLRIGARASNIVDIYSGTIHSVAGFAYQWSGSKGYGPSTYNIYGGTVEWLMAGAISAQSGTPYVKGDFIANIYGGNVDRLFINAWCNSGALSYVEGNTIINVEDGFVPNITFGSSYLHSTSMAQTPGNNGNIAVIVNGSKTEASKTTINGNDNVQYIKKGNGKKFMAIINNAEGNKAAFAETLNTYFVNALDYKIAVTGGEAQPVFEGTGASATLLGFSLTASDAKKSTPAINGEALEPAGTTDDGVVYYTIPSTLGTDNITEINFVNELPILDGEHYVKYGGTGIGNSASSPAPSVAWLINNVIADNYDADDTVSIYIMQDDAEILYNSTIYANGGANYTAPVIGGNGYKVPEHHITTWYSGADGTAKSHTATIRIKSYADGTSAQNYLATWHQLGYNYTLNLQGPTIFEDINILNPYSSLCNIAANGFDYTISEATERYTLKASRYNAEHQWNGVFTKADKWHGLTLGAGSTYTGSYNTVAPGGNLILNKKIKMQWVTNKTDASTQRFTIGSGVNGTVFSGSIGAVINTASELSLDIGSGSEGKTNTINGNVNVVVNSAKVKLYFRGISPSDTTIGGAIQLIRANDTFIGGIYNLADYGVDFWNIQTANAIGILDVTDVAGKYALTDSSLKLVAIKQGTNLAVKSENGYLDLTAYGAGDWDVYSAAAAEGDYIDLDKAVYAIKDTTIDLSTLNPTVTEGYAFLGFKLDGEYVNGSTVALSAGQILIAEFAEYSVENDGDFFIKGIQMRVDGKQGVRFIVQLNKSAAAVIGGLDSIIDYGSLVLPVEYSQGRDLRYGEEIVVAGVNYGAPAVVPAVNIYAQSDSYVQYTVVVANIAESKFNRHYAVQGYLRYYDHNGVERVLYSGYGQSSLYRTALHLSADEEAPQYQKDAAAEVVNYVQGGALEANYNAAITKTPIGVAANREGLSAYKLSNGVAVVEYDINWYNNSKVTDLVQFTDVHFVYQNSLDKYLSIEATNDAFSSSGRTWYYGLPNVIIAARLMQFAQFADRTVVTGDIVDYTSNGTMQVANRIIFGQGANVNGFSTVLSAIGNHERTDCLGTAGWTNIDSANKESDTLEIVAGNYDNNITFHSEMVTNKGGENGVMVVVMDNQYEEYTDATIPAKLTAAITAAREAGAPVIIFQHVPLAGKNEQPLLELGQDEIAAYYLGKIKSEENVFEQGTLSDTVYDIITDNADVIKGIFCGHIHANEYNELIGTDANNTVIPQIALGGAHLDGGYALKINIK